jgi:hypothetical protein
VRVIIFPVAPKMGQRQERKEFRINNRNNVLNKYTISNSIKYYLNIDNKYK